MVRRNSGAINLVKPINIIVHQVCIFSSFSSGSGCICAQLVSREDLKVLEHATEGNVSVIGHFRFLTGFTFLGSNEDDTVRSTATVDSGCGCVFQYGEGLDIVRVHHRQRVRHTRHTIVIHCQTINDNKRVVGCVQRRSTTDTNRSATTRSTTVSSDIHTGHLTRKHVLRVGNQTLVHLIRFDRRY